MSLLKRATVATGILEELTASGMDEGIGTDHPVHAAITYIQSPLDLASRAAASLASIKQGGANLVDLLK